MKNMTNTNYKEKNFQLLKSRYKSIPGYIEKIEFLEKTKVPNNLPRPYVELPFKEIEDKVEESHPKVLITCGMFDKQMLQECLSIPKFHDIQHVFVIENSPEVLAYRLSTEDWSAVIMNARFDLLLGVSLDEADNTFYRSFTRPDISMFYKRSIFLMHPNQSKEEREFYKQFRQKYLEASTRYAANTGEISDYMEGVRASVANTNRLRTCPGIEDLHGKAKGKNFLLVGAGPSLEDQLPLIKKHQAKFIIIAADAAVKPLIDNGIKAHYAVSIERWNKAQKRFWKDLPKDSPLMPELIGFAVVHGGSFDLFPGNIRILYRNYSYYHTFSKWFPKCMMQSYSSCIHLAQNIADYMGCSHMYMVGSDLSYRTAGKDSYISHTKGTNFIGDWDNAYSQAELEEKHPRRKPFFKVKSYAGDEILTDRVYHKWSVETSQRSIERNWGNKIIQCTKSSPANYNIAYRDFKEVCESLPEVQFEMPVYTQLNLPSGHYPTLLKFLDGYKNRLREVVAWIDRGDVSNTALKAIHSYLFDIIQKDAFMSSWPIQCCTREFFQAGNEYNKLPTNIDLDTEEEKAQRIHRLKEILTLVSNVCSLLVDSINKGLKNKELIDNGE